MVAIVIYKEANIVAIISILISMLSVASKSFVFSIASALTIKQLFFNWLSGITDFFGIFFAVSWVFYEPESEYLNDAFVTIQTVWLYRLYCCTLPMIVSLSMFGFAVGIEEMWPDTSTMYLFGKCCSRFFAIVIVIIMWMCGIIASALAFEIISWTWAAGTLFALGTQRFPQNAKSGEFYFTIIGWINSAKKHHVGTRYKGCTSYTKYQDKMMRLSSFHHVMLLDGQRKTTSYKREFDDHVCQAYLEKEMDTQYMNVTMEGLRINSEDRKTSEFWPRFCWLYLNIWEEVSGYFMNHKHEWNVGRLFLESFAVIFVGIGSFILGPIYLLSRLWSLFFPIWIVLYIYFGFGVNVWNTTDIALFQVVMMTIYLGLCGILWILFIFNLREQYIMHHIFPSRKYFRSNFYSDNTEELLQEITNHYFGIIVVPIRRAIIIDHFGPDLGPIILSYLPAKDEYDAKQNITKVRTV